MKNLTKSMLLASSIILAITGCTTDAPLKSNPTLPKVKELRSLSDRNAIALEWDVVNQPEIFGYYIQRSATAKKYETVKKIESKYVGHWTDTDLKPNTMYYYKISTYTTKGVPSFAKFKQVKTLPTISPVSFVANAHLKARGLAKIIFRPAQNERVEGYEIQRFNDSSTKWETIAKLEPRLRAEYIDKNLIDGKVYRYRIIAYTFDGLRSLPSKVVSIQTLQKPKAITNFMASTDLAKKIKLSWQSIKGAVEYRIYSSASELGEGTLLAQTKATTYVDDVGKNGFSKFYRVTSVDKYGIESMKSQAVMGATLPLPAKPIVSIERNAKSLTFVLSSPDKRAVKYLIKKYYNNRVVKIHNVKSPYTDNRIVPKMDYKYEIYAIDSNKLVSKPTIVEAEF